MSEDGKPMEDVVLASSLDQMTHQSSSHVDRIHELEEENKNLLRLIQSAWDAGSERAAWIENSFYRENGVKQPIDFIGFLKKNKLSK